MFRLALFPVILLISSTLLVVVLYILYKKIKSILLGAYKKSAGIASDKHQQWKNKEQRKQLPEMLQKGFDDYDQIQSISQKLPEKWQSLIKPLSLQAKQILVEIAFSCESKKGKDKVNSMRTFFIHTMDALVQFVEKIESDSSLLGKEETKRAEDNIRVLEADLAHHQNLLEKKRKLDFDILMDVIKARLKS